jgi:hypothetical protein
MRETSLGFLSAIILSTAILTGAAMAADATNTPSATNAAPAPDAAALAKATEAMKAGEIVQIDTSDVFNSRPIATVVDGKLVVMDLDAMGPDKYGSGLITQAAEKLATGKDDPRALPNDGRFPATDRHPDVVLAYGGNDDGKKKFARKCAGPDEFTITIPAKKYSKLFLFLTSSGKSPMTIDLKYQDGSADTHSVTVPDWYDQLTPDNPDWSYLAPELSKWSVDTTQWPGARDMKVKMGHHYVYVLTLNCDPAKILQNVSFKKATQKQVTTFFGATGLVVQ